MSSLIGGPTSVGGDFKCYANWLLLQSKYPTTETGIPSNEVNLLLAQ